MKKLKIGTVARLTGFSPSGIRFYEDRGFIHPTHEGDGQYRSFDLNDVARLLDCKNYRECGCTSTEIIGILQASPTATISSANKAMEAVSSRICKEIRHQENLAGFIAERLASLNVIAANEHGVALTQSPAFYWARLWIPQEEEDVEPIIPSEEDGFRIPFADASLLLEEDCFENADENTPVPVCAPATKPPCRPHVGYSIARKYTDEAPHGQHVQFLPSQRCLHTIIEVSTDFSINQDQLQSIRQSLRNEHLVTNGRPFTHRIITFYEGNEEKRFDDLWVPVCEK